MKRIPLSLFLLVLSHMLTIPVLAGEITFRARLSADEVKPQASLKLSDDRYTSGAWYSDLELVRSVVRVKLGLDTEAGIKITSSPAIIAVVDINYFDKDHNPYSVTGITLEINYDPASGSSIVYTDLSAYQFMDAYKLDATIQSMDLGGCSACQDMLFFEVELVVERFEDADFSDFWQAPLNAGIDHQYISDTDELEVYWEYMSGAEVYDLEWTYVSTVNVDAGQTGALPYTFRNNSTRVTVGENYYRLPLLYEAGYILYRVRGVTYRGDDFKQRIEAAWSSDQYSGNTLQDYGDKYHWQNGHDVLSGVVRVKNRVSQSIYIEEGKRKDLVSYVDGAGYTRQQVTRSSSEGTALAEEQYYDHQGRVAVTALPAPTFEPVIRHYESFNRSATSGQAFGRSDFDLDHASTACEVTINPMSATSSGAAYYYSSNSLVEYLNNVSDPYTPKSQTRYHWLSHLNLPESDGYPFVQVEYTPDNTGRIRRQSGPGATFQLGSGHETRYYYGTPFQKELDRLFGSDVGFSQHYRKNLVIDPNGQVSVSYLDGSGRVIATALAGDAPGELEALPSHAGGIQEDFEVDLLSTQQTDLNEGILLSTEQLLVTDAGDHVFEYSLENTPYSHANFCEILQEGTSPPIINLCWECVYDLEIVLRDECGAIILENRERIGMSLNNICTTMSALDYSWTETVPLNPGQYTLHKRLQVNQESLESYTQDYLESGFCQKSLQDFLDEELAQLDLSGCGITCEDCAASPPPASPAHPDDLDCAGDCENPDWCEAFYTMLLADISPGGQYADFSWDNSNPASPVISLFTPGVNVLSSNSVLKAYPSTTATLAPWRNPCSTYLDEDGSLSVVLLADGTTAIPQNLNSLDEFLANWRPSWAISLACYHPEYCYYDFCASLHGEGSTGHDIAMLNTDDYASATAAGYLDNVGNANNNPDPYFKTGGTGAGQATAMNSKIATYTSTYSMEDLAVMSVLCPGTGTCTLHVLGSDAQTADAEWQMYRSLYLSYKQILIRAHFEANEANCYDAIEDIGEVSPWNDKSRRTPDAGQYDDYLTSPPNPASLDDAALASAVGVALAASCDNTCEGYRSMWEDMLSDCIDFSTAPGIALMDELLEICKGGCDENNPFGAGSLPGSNTTTNGNRNFAEVLIYHLGSGAIDGDCNADIIGLPLAYGHPYFGGNITNGIAPGPDLVVNGNFSNGTQVFSNTFKTDLVLSYLTIDNSCPADPLSPGSPYASSNFNIDASISSQATPLDNTYNSSVQNNISLDYIYAISPWNYQWKHYESGIDCPPNVQHRYTIASDPYKLNTSWPSPPPGKRDFAMVVSGAPSYSAYSPNTSLYENCNSGTNDHWYVWQQEIEVDCNTTYIFQVDVMGLHDDGGAILSLMAGCEELSGAADIQVSSTSFWNWTTITGTWYSGNCTGTQDVSISIIEKSFRTGMATGSFAIDSIRFYSRGDDCADCIQVESAQSAFLTQYGSSIVNETNYQVMFQNYLNEELHLNLSYWEYADFLAVCAGNDTASLCNESMFPQIPVANTCYTDAMNLAQSNAQARYEAYLDEVANAFRQDYLAHCMNSLTEAFHMQYDRTEHHYTLYYYSPEGNLVKTVPPAGVQTLSPQALPNAAAYRQYRSQLHSGGSAPPQYPGHGLTTSYHYTSLNQVYFQETPDGGARRTWFDEIGRPVLSQDARQEIASPKRYSYTQYDALGRPVETGQYSSAMTAQDPVLATSPFLLYGSFVPSPGKSQIRKTYYDEQTVLGTGILTQAHLRNRVATVISQEFDGQPADWATHYSYDAHGNVAELVQEIVELSVWDMQYKHMAYDYDLHSGKVNAFRYQEGEADAFQHRYRYDADNRLREVLSSRYGVFEDREAKYFYYLHGPLARVETGHKKVQAQDYAYTLQGWIKGVNSATLSIGRDPGKDGMQLAPGNQAWVHSYVAPDSTGYELGYHDSDYSPIFGYAAAAQPFAPVQGGSAILSNQRNLYNGNIRHMVSAIGRFMGSEGPLYKQFTYDQLNRIAGMQVFTDPGTSGVVAANAWSSAAANNSAWETAYAYDANGNITSLLRHADGGTAMDNLSYTYAYQSGQLQHNRLLHVNDAVGTNAYDDIEDQGSSSNPNYTYDAIGNLVKDLAEGLDSIRWDIYGKITAIDKDAGPSLVFGYSGTGERVIKGVTNAANPQFLDKSYYVRDASGNLLARYKAYVNSGQTYLALEELALYGSDRLGLLTENQLLYQEALGQYGGGTVYDPPATTGIYTHVTGKRLYELKNHLGNVVSVVSDDKKPYFTGSSLTHFGAAVASAQDYYPFGMIMPGRSYAAGDYRFGFNGMEKDDEVKGQGNSHTTYYRNLDVRLGKWLSIDPKSNEYPDLSPYSFVANNPLLFIDHEGDLIKLAPGLKAEEKERIVAQLQKLTDDKLRYRTLEDGSVLVDIRIRTEESKVSRKSGTGLIRDLVDHNKTVTLVKGISGSAPYESSEDDPNAYNGIGANSKINLGDAFPPFLVKDEKSGETYYKRSHDFIVIGHELIHSLRTMEGISIPLEETAEHVYILPEGIPNRRRTENHPLEEYITTGIYDFRYGGPRERSFKYTENQLRRENQLEARVSYDTYGIFHPDEMRSIPVKEKDEK